MTQNEVITFLDRPFHVVRKSQRRSLVIKLHPNKQNQILANKSVSHAVINQFLLSKSSWIEKNLKKIENYKSSIKIPNFKDGEFFPYFGELKYFKVVPTHFKKVRIELEDGFLICYLPKEKPELLNNKEKLQTELIRFYKVSAHKYLISRCEHLASMTGLIPNKIKIQTARSRWGSCNSQKTINLNWKLIVFSQSLIDYVIIHELCHLRHLNHSPQFWNLVEQHCQNYKEIQSYLKDQTPGATFLDLF